MLLFNFAWKVDKFHLLRGNAMMKKFSKGWNKQCPVNIGIKIVYKEGVSKGMSF